MTNDATWLSGSHSRRLGGNHNTWPRSHSKKFGPMPEIVLTTPDRSRSYATTSAPRSTHERRAAFARHESGLGAYPAGSPRGVGVVWGRREESGREHASRRVVGASAARRGGCGVRRGAGGGGGRRAGGGRGPSPRRR